MNTIPAMVRMLPMRKNSQRLNGSSPFWRNALLASRLTVVNRVAMPPSSVPKESGINSIEERIRVCRAMPVRPGRSTDAEAMLFMTNESVAEAAMVNAISLPSLLPAVRRRYLPIQAAMPVFVTPVVTRKMAAIVTTAGLPNPASASAASRVPLRIRAITVNIATTSGPYLPVMNIITAPARMPRTTPISRLINSENRSYASGRQEVYRVAPPQAQN